VTNVKRDFRYLRINRGLHKTFLRVVIN